MKYTITALLLIVAITQSERVFETFLRHPEMIKPENIEKTIIVYDEEDLNPTINLFDTYKPVFLTVLKEDEDEIKTGDELGIRAGGEPPLKTGEKAGNTLVASTKIRFKIPNMNA